MPFTTEQLAAGGRAAIDYYLKNDPVDQVNTAHPLLKWLMEGRKQYSGGLQYIVEQLRKSNDSNFQSYFGSSQVTYNRKRTLAQAKFSYGSFHDGFGLDEDELMQNGIVMTDDRSNVPSDAERVQLTNIMEENKSTLKLGFEENFDLMIHRDGTQNPLDIPGLDLLVATDPTSSTEVGTINQNTNAFWRNVTSQNIVTTDSEAFIDELERVWRETTRFGRKAPNKILAGGDFIDAFRKAAKDTVNREIRIEARGGTNIDPSVTGCFFHNVELTWDPVFDTLDALDSPTIPWVKRAYFLNMDTIKLRPLTGHWMVSRTPPRVYDRYVHYWGLTSKAALTINQRNANAVVSIY